MKDKDKLTPLLRGFKLGHVDLDYSIDFILNVYRHSRRFNLNSFSLGMLVGSVVTLVVLYFKS